jgi:hypothetical protein
MNAVGASLDFGPGTVRVDNSRHHVTSVGPNGVEWIRGSTVNPTTWTGAGNSTLSMSFETPVGGNCGKPGGTGRVFYNGMHVSEARSTGSTFPTNCDLSYPLTPEEKALEYQFFQLTACQIGGTPPPPMAAPELPPVTFVRDFESTCNEAAGETVRWSWLQWQATIPEGTSISFRAATADTQAELPPAPPPGSQPPLAPSTAHVAVADTTVPVAPAPPNPLWGRSAEMVDARLRSDTATASKRWLRVYMTFNPHGAVAPVLNAWRQSFQCIPIE